MQSFVLDAAENPYNVVEPGKRPRVTLTPTMALKDGKPYLAFAVQGGDTQDQNLLQFFLNVVEFGMDVQEAVGGRQHHQLPDAAPRSATTSPARPADGARGHAALGDRAAPAMGYDVETDRKTSGPINAIWFDREHGTMWGGCSDYGEDYGVGW